jgi:hypothetical protein
VIAAAVQRGANLSLIFALALKPPTKLASVIGQIAEKVQFDALRAIGGGV